MLAWLFAVVWAAPPGPGDVLPEFSAQWVDDGSPVGPTEERYQIVELIRSADW